MSQLRRWFSWLALPVALVCLVGCGAHASAAHIAARNEASSAPAVPDQRAAVATQFVTTALSYDSTTQTPTTFIDALASITTSAERIRLEGSSRAGLNWPALQARAEKATIEIVSVTAATPPAVVVEAQRTTITSFATVTEPVEVTLRMDRVDGAWQVTEATGGGL